MSCIISNKRFDKYQLHNIQKQIDNHENYHRNLAARRLEEEEKQRTEQQVKKGELFEQETQFFGKIAGRITNLDTSAMILSLGNGYDGHSLTLNKTQVCQLIDKLSKLHENMADRYTPPESETTNQCPDDESDYYDSD